MASCVKQGLFYYGQDPVLGEIRGMDPWAVDNGIHLLRMESDAAEGIMRITERNTQQYGTVHGGMLVALADTVAGHSLMAQGKVCVTQSSTVSFLKAAKGEYLLCRAVPQQVGHRVCVVSAETRNDRDELVTTALFTFAVVGEAEPVILPPEEKRTIP